MDGFRARKHRRTSYVVLEEGTSVSSLPLEVDRTASLEEQARQFRLLLQGLGPTYSCFSLYLSSRIDLLPTEFCREFALTPDSASPLAPSETQRVLRQELGDRCDSAFSEFSYVPSGATLLTQYHPATLASGIRVIVVILRPEYHALQGGPAMPPSLSKDLVRQLCGPEATEHVFLDFVSALRRKTNFSIQAENMELVAFDKPSSELRVPRIYRELCTSRILTLERIGRKSLDGGQSHSCLARRLCQSWLQQALCGHGFPVDPQPHNVALAEDNRILFTGCDFTVLSQISQENLWNYFMATAVEDPDRAMTCLLREMSLTQSAKIDAESFRSKFRQAAYFGSLEPVLGTNSNALAQLLFQHWKTALEFGYAPKPHLLCFYRGLFSVARIAHKFSPLGDPLREGLEEVRADRTIDQVKEILDWRYWVQNSDKFATALVNLPKMLDDALTHASAPGSGAPAKSEAAPQRAALLKMAALLVVAVILLASRSSGTNPLTEKLTLILVFLAGLVALRD